MDDYRDDEAKHHDDENRDGEEKPRMPVVVTMNNKEQRFYDKLRRQLREKIDAYRDKLGSDTADYLLLLPDLFVLFVRLARDRRVSSEAKVIAGIVLAYIISPIDIIPDMVFGLGWVDDVILAVYALKRILVDTDQEVLLEHWTGDADLLEKVQEIIGKADQIVGSRVVNAIRRTLSKRK